MSAILWSLAAAGRAGLQLLGAIPERVLVIAAALALSFALGYAGGAIRAEQRWSARLEREAKEQDRAREIARAARAVREREEAARSVALAESRAAAARRRAARLEVILAQLESNPSQSDCRVSAERMRLLDDAGRRDP